MHKFWLIAAALLITVGCSSNNLPNPTTVPTRVPSTATLKPSAIPQATAAQTTGATVTFRPMITATGGSTAVAVAQGTATMIPTATPVCLVAKANDTVISLLFKGGYGDTSALEAFRALNKMAPSSNAIQVGSTYCIPVRDRKSTRLNSSH